MPVHSSAFAKLRVPAVPAPAAHPPQDNEALLAPRSLSREATQTCYVARYSVRTQPRRAATRSQRNPAGKRAPALVNALFMFISGCLGLRRSSTRVPYPNANLFCCSANQDLNSGFIDSTVSERKQSETHSRITTKQACRVYAMEEMPSTYLICSLDADGVMKRQTDSSPEKFHAPQTPPSSWTEWRRNRRKSMQ